MNNQTRMSAIVCTFSVAALMTALTCAQGWVCWHWPGAHSLSQPNDGQAVACAMTFLLALGTVPACLCAWINGYEA